MKAVFLLASIGILMGIGILAGFRWFPIDFVPSIRSGARENDLDPYLVAALIRVESTFRPLARSSSGAFGPMQLLPSTANWLQEKTNLPGNWMTPSVNIQLGTRYLRYLLDTFDNDIEIALTAYNKGQGTVRRELEEGVFAPTDYTRRVLAFRWVYFLLYFGFFMD